MISVSQTAVSARFGIAKAGLGYRAYHVTAETTAPLAACESTCRDELPNSGSIAYRLHSYFVSGCVPRSPWVNFDAHPHRKELALTFDDGPNPPYTGEMLRCSSTTTFPPRSFRSEIASPRATGRCCSGCWQTATPSAITPGIIT